MSTAIVETNLLDAFRLARTTAVANSTSGLNVRRPLSGIQLKKDTFASFSVLGPGSETSSFVNSSSGTEDSAGIGRANYTTNFILEAVSEARSEKFQPITTFGASYGYFFGEQPRMITAQARLLNTADFQWELEWWENYDRVLRGTQLVNGGMRAYLEYDDRVIGGYLVQASVNKSASDPLSATLSFSMWVVSYDTLIRPGDTKIDERHLGSPESEKIEFVDVPAAGTDAPGDDGRLARAATNLRNFTGAVGSRIRSLEDFLLGRNMVIPRDYASSDFSAGSISGGAVTIRVPRLVRADPLEPNSALFFDNSDEFVQREYSGGGSTSPTVESRAGRDQYEGRDTEATYKAFESKAREAFLERGINPDARRTSDTRVLRTLGRASYGVISLGADATGIAKKYVTLANEGSTRVGELLLNQARL